MHLVFDTETTGLPRNRNAHFSDLDNWPRLVQIAWLLFDQDGELQENKNFIILPEGFSIPDEAAKIHGITTERAVEEGIPVRKVLAELSASVDRSHTLVAHNIAFDENVICAEFLRAELSHRILQKERICTMIAGTEYCQIPGPYGYKWPTLSELYYALFKEDFTEAHDAGIDVTACARCYFRLKDLHLF